MGVQRDNSFIWLAYTNPQKWEEMLILTRYNNHLSARPPMQHIPKGPQWLTPLQKTCHPSEPPCGIKVGLQFSRGRGSDTRITKATVVLNHDLPSSRGCPSSRAQLQPRLQAFILQGGGWEDSLRCLSFRRVTHGAEDNTTDGQRGWQPL